MYFSCTFISLFSWISFVFFIFFCGKNPTISKLKIMRKAFIRHTIALCNHHLEDMASISFTSMLQTQKEHKIANHYNTEL